MSATTVAAYGLVQTESAEGFVNGFGFDDERMAWCMKAEVGIPSSSGASGADRDGQCTRDEA